MDHGFLSAADLDPADLIAVVDRSLDAAEAPLAGDIVSGVPVYDGAFVDSLEPGTDRHRELLTEWATMLADGPGCLAIRGAYADTAVLDEAAEVFFSIIEEERAAGGGGGDHFAKAGANDRIWNSHEKLAVRAPEVFTRYYSNATIAEAATAWLGPHYQLTAQVNVVNPGGDAQNPHRDYHLGFYLPEQTFDFPLHVHRMSAMLTLQGAVAHSDMPIESGPTKILPWSQHYRAGFAIAKRPEFDQVFEDRFVQIELRKGDALFFNPALLHAAGQNRTSDVIRMANLMQISSAFGRAMEWRDTDAMCLAVYPHLAAADLKPVDVARVVAAVAEGYAFPTSLDLDPPIGGLAPESQADILRRALTEGWATDVFAKALNERNLRRPQER
ncbi:MAG: phytanoyl-CoA dioxygenase family protein [Ilumatobacteraceae bacterium]